MPAVNAVPLHVVVGLAVVACMPGMPSMPVMPGGAVEPPQPTGRIAMRQLSPAAMSEPPTARDLVDARDIFRRRFGDLVARSRSAAAAVAAANALIDAAMTERDAALQWLMLAEARRLAAAAGDATTLDRALVLASAGWDFDAIDEEYRLLKGIPLRALDVDRAAALARVAETLATRAETDGRRDAAAAAQALAVRGWQQAGDGAAARQAVVRLDGLDPLRGLGRFRRSLPSR